MTDQLFVITFRPYLPDYLFLVTFRQVDNISTITPGRECTPGPSCSTLRVPTSDVCFDVGTIDDLTSNSGESTTGTSGRKCTSGPKCTPGPTKSSPVGTTDDLASNSGGSTDCTPGPKPTPGPTKSTSVHSKCSPAFLDKILDFNFDDRVLNVNDVFFDGDNGEDSGVDGYTLGWVQVVAKRCAKVYLSPVYGPSPPLVAKHIREMSDAAVKEVFKPDVSTRAGRILNELLGGRYCWQWSASLAGKAAALHRCKVRGMLVMMSYNVHGFPNGKRHSLTCHKYKDTYRAKWCRLGFGRSVFDKTDVRHIVKRRNGERYRSDIEEAAGAVANAVEVGVDDECESEPGEYVGFSTDDESTFEQAACAAVMEVESMNSDSDSASSECVPRSPRKLTTGSALEYTPEKQTRCSQSERRISSSRVLFSCGEKRGNDNKDYGIARKRKRGNMMTPYFHSCKNDDSNGHYREQQTEACDNDVPLLGCDKNVLHTFGDTNGLPRKRKRDKAMTSCSHDERDYNGETCENEKTEHFEVDHLSFNILANFSNLSDFVLLVIHHYVFRPICVIALTFILLITFHFIEK